MFFNYLTALFTGTIGTIIAAITKDTSTNVNMTFKFKLIITKQIFLSEENCFVSVTTLSSHFGSISRKLIYSLTLGY